MFVLDEVRGMEEIGRLVREVVLVFLLVRDFVRCLWVEFFFFELDLSGFL